MALSTKILSIITHIKNILISGGSLKWLKEEALKLKVMSSNPGTRWIFFTLICRKICIVCLKKTENKQKRLSVSLLTKEYSVLKVGHSQPLLIYFRLFNTVDRKQVNKDSI